MAKCVILGKIRVPVGVGQAILLNGKKCDEETVWSVDAFGGESKVTDFTIQNRSNKAVDIEFNYSTPTAGDGYSITVLDASDDSIVFPFNIAKETVNWKLKVDFDKYVKDAVFEIVLELDYVI